MKGEEIFGFFEKPAPFEDVERVLKSLTSRDEVFLRDEAVHRYGFAIPCVEAVRLISAYSPLLEIGAGSGYWARLLREAGADIIATDLRDGSPYSKRWGGGGVEVMSATDAIGKWPDRNIFVSWPSDSLPWCAEAAKKLARGKTFVYLGEPKGGCTADDYFFEVLDRDYFRVGTMAVPRWLRMDDFLGVYVKR